MERTYTDDMGEISGRGTAAHCTCPREMRAMTDEEMSASQTAAPLAESGAAPGAAPAPDDPIEELEVMLEDFVDAVRRDDPLHPHFDAIRAHVAQRERAAREAGRAEMGEVVGTATVTPHWEDGYEYLPHITPHMNCANGRTEPYTVDLVLRRDTEGV